MIQLSDQGVVLFLTGDASTSSSGTVKDKRGVAMTPGQLGASYVAGAALQVGRATGLSLWVKMRMHTATSITIKVTGQRADSVNNPSLWGSALIQLVAEDDGSSNHAAQTAAEQQFTVANIGVDTVFNTVLQTTSQFLSGDLVVSAHANAGGLDARDYVIVGIDAA